MDLKGFDPQQYDDTETLILEYWRAFHLQYGTPPTAREALAALPSVSSTSVINYHLRHLIAAGTLTRVAEMEGQPRCIVPTDWQDRVVRAVARREAA